jgi:hypothetical protein
MKPKAYLVAACLLIGAILVSCGPDGPDIPRGARKALRDYLGGSDGYSVVSAEQAAHPARVPADEAWCIAIDPPQTYIIHPSGSAEVLWLLDIFIITRLGDKWQTMAVPYYIHNHGYDYELLAERIPKVLTLFGCDTTAAEWHPVPSDHPSQPDADTPATPTHLTKLGTAASLFDDQLLNCPRIQKMDLLPPVSFG